MDTIEPQRPCCKRALVRTNVPRQELPDSIGVDIKGARLWKGAKYATETGLQNVAFLRTRIEFIEAFFAPGEISEIWLTFSDPQMKSENSRLTSPMFLERYRHFLKPGGIVHLKTDSTFLYEYTKQLCAANNLHVLASTSDLYGVEKASECRDGQVDSPESNPRESLYSSEFSSVCGKAAVDALFEVPSTMKDLLSVLISMRLTGVRLRPRVSFRAACRPPENINCNSSRGRDLLSNGL